MPTNDDQARQRLVEIALETAAHIPCPGCRAGDCNGTEWRPLACAVAVRKLAGFKSPSKGHWCAAGLTAAMDKAGLLAPAPGTPARRGAVALLDWVGGTGRLVISREDTAADGIEAKPLRIGQLAKPGDVIAWLQHPPPDPAGWRRGHVAVVVAVDDEILTTVGWNEGSAPGRVMKRRLWRDAQRPCGRCKGSGMYQVEWGTDRPYVRGRGRPGATRNCTLCKSTGCVLPSQTVIARKQGLLYGIARPVAA